jgi:hypothetical protein
MHLHHMLPQFVLPRRRIPLIPKTLTALATRNRTPKHGPLLMEGIVVSFVVDAAIDCSAFARGNAALEDIAAGGMRAIREYDHVVVGRSANVAGLCWEWPEWDGGMEV